MLRSGMRCVRGLRLGGRSSRGLRALPGSRMVFRLRPVFGTRRRSRLGMLYRGRPAFGPCFGLRSRSRRRWMACFVGFRGRTRGWFRPWSRMSLGGRATRCWVRLRMGYRSGPGRGWSRLAGCVRGLWFGPGLRGGVRGSGPGFAGRVGRFRPRFGASRGTRGACGVRGFGARCGARSFGSGCFGPGLGSGF
jgi:hypothetical protein